MTSEFERAIRREVAQWQGAGVAFGERSKHSQAAISVGAQSRRVIVARSASDHRALRNVLGEVRRTLRHLGAARAP